MIFLFDEQLSKHVAHALNILQERMNRRNKTGHKVQHVTDMFPRGASDTKIFKNFPKNGIFISLDLNQQRVPKERILIDQLKLSIIYFRSKQDLNFWKQARLFVNVWPDVLEFVDQQKQPFIKRYKPQEIRRLVK